MSAEALRRDPSCMRDMLWRIELDPTVDIAGLGRQLVARGWTDRSRLPLLLDLEGPEGHALVMVPRTRRVQLRLHYLTRPDAREGAARATYEGLVEVATFVKAGCSRDL